MAILASERNNALTTINNARKKWGLAVTGSNVAVGTIADATNGVNNLLVWLREAKTKSGSNVSIMNNISSGTIMTNVYTGIVSSANTIYNYCKCHGNCSGSCTNSCTNGCTNKCTACYGCSGCEGCTSCMST